MAKLNVFRFFVVLALALLLSGQAWAMFSGTPKSVTLIVDQTKVQEITNQVKGHPNIEPLYNELKGLEPKKGFWESVGSVLGVSGTKPNTTAYEQTKTALNQYIELTCKLLTGAQYSGAIMTQQRVMPTLPQVTTKQSAMQQALANNIANQLAQVITANDIQTIHNDRSYNLLVSKLNTHLLQKTTEEKPNTFKTQVIDTVTDSDGVTKYKNTAPQTTAYTFFAGAQPQDPKTIHDLSTKVEAAIKLQSEAKKAAEDAKKKEAEKKKTDPHPEPEPKSAKPEPEPTEPEPATEPTPEPTILSALNKNHEYKITFDESWKLPQQQQGLITFNVGKGQNDFYVGLSPTKQDPVKTEELQGYAIVFGGWENSKWAIFKHGDSELVHTADHAVQADSESNPFWVQFFGNTITAGYGDSPSEENTILKHRVDKGIKNIAYVGFGGAGTINFSDIKIAVAEEDGAKADELEARKASLPKAEHDDYKKKTKDQDKAAEAEKRAYERLRKEREQREQRAREEREQREREAQRNQEQQLVERNKKLEELKSLKNKHIKTHKAILTELESEPESPEKQTVIQAVNELILLLEASPDAYSTEQLTQRIAQIQPQIKKVLSALKNMKTKKPEPASEPEKPKTVDVDPVFAQVALTKLKLSNLMYLVSGASAPKAEPKKPESEPKKEEPKQPDTEAKKSSPGAGVPSGGSGPRMGQETKGRAAPKKRAAATQKSFEQRQREKEERERREKEERERREQEERERLERERREEEEERKRKESEAPPEEGGVEVDEDDDAQFNAVKNLYEDKQDYTNSQHKTEIDTLAANLLRYTNQLLQGSGVDKKEVNELVASWVLAMGEDFHGYFEHLFKTYSDTKAPIEYFDFNKAGELHIQRQRGQMKELAQKSFKAKRLVPTIHSDDAEQLVADAVAEWREAQKK
ncbi:MAG: hypothetical protein H6679_04645 [Epsilonproteobacteria bacterium]|nr:hypothetical protein [Campylobacterota bacterium]